MKRIFCIGFFIVLHILNLNSQILFIPEDYPSIQEGISTASEGDTVLVAPGTYYENLEFNGTNITLASLFLLTNDTSYISSTIIDGNMAGTAIKVHDDEDTSTLICGFTIINGHAFQNGGGVFLDEASPILDHLRIYNCKANNGGGIFVSDCEPIIRNCHIEHNNASFNGGGIYMVMNDYTNYEPILDHVKVRFNSSKSGGGIYFSEIDPILIGSTISYNSAETGGGGIYSAGYPEFDEIDRCNIYLNSAIYCNDVQPYHYLNIVVDTFTVLIPTDFHINPLNLVNLDILNSKLVQIEQDLYISPEGSNENSGLTAEDPLKTIHFAMSILLASDTSQRNILLLDGIYSPSTNNEFFPINMINNVNLIGTVDSLVTLDADSTSRVLQIIEKDSNLISNLTITGGYYLDGAGLKIRESNPVLDHLIIEGNSTGNDHMYSGGGINAVNSTFRMSNIMIRNNNSKDTGGGIYLDQSSADMYNVSIIGNTTELRGGGLGYNGTDTLMLNGITIIGNRANDGGGISITGPLVFRNGLIADNIASQFGGGIYARDSIWLYNTDLISNSAKNGGGIAISNTFAKIDSLTFKYNSSLTSGGGIYSEGVSNTILEHISIFENSATNGGGIYCFNGSSLSLSGTKIINNHAVIGGGLSWYSEQPLIFDTSYRCNIYLNSAELFGSDLSSYIDSVFVVVDTFTVLYPTEFHAEAIQSFIFDILAGKTELVDDDLFVSPEGNDTNSGLTPEYPLRTIRKAFSKLRSDPGHHNTVYLANGIYNYSSGYDFPVRMLNNASLVGEDPALTILDAEQTGSVILLQKDTIPLIENLTLRGGSESRGGAISSAYSEFHGRNLHIKENVSELEGGGIYVIDNNNSSLSNLTMENNSSVYGGGVYLENSLMELKTAEFRNNFASYGGGIAIVTSDSTTLSGLLFADNQAYSKGGGIFIHQTKGLKVLNSEFDSNISAEGGGIYSSYSSLELKNSLLTNNMGIHTASGIELYQDYEFDGTDIESRIINTTFSDNITTSLACYSAGVSLINNIFWGNSGQYQIQFQETGTFSDTLRIMNTTVQNGLNGIGIIGQTELIWLDGNSAADPLFIETGSYPYSLAPGSPCIDFGTPDTSGLFLPYNDIIGNTRVWDGNGDGLNKIDMGAYEYDAPVFIVDSLISRDSSPFLTIMYPNPAKDRLTVKWINNQGDINVSLLNSTGEYLFSSMVPSNLSSLSIDLKPYDQGIYIIILKDRKGAGKYEKLILMD